MEDTERPEVEEEKVEGAVGSADRTRGDLGGVSLFFCIFILVDYFTERESETWYLKTFRNRYILLQLWAWCCCI